MSSARSLHLSLSLPAPQSLQTPLVWIGTDGMALPHLTAQTRKMSAIEDIDGGIAAVNVMVPLRGIVQHAKVIEKYKKGEREREI
jgi:hypothetical protein